MEKTNTTFLLEEHPVTQYSPRPQLSCKDDDNKIEIDLKITRKILRDCKPEEYPTIPLTINNNDIASNKKTLNAPFSNTTKRDQRNNDNEEPDTVAVGHFIDRAMSTLSRSSLTEEEQEQEPLLNERRQQEQEQEQEQEPEDWQRPGAYAIQGSETVQVNSGFLSLLMNQFTAVISNHQDEQQFVRGEEAVAELVTPPDLVTAEPIDNTLTINDVRVRNLKRCVFLLILFVAVAVAVAMYGMLKNSNNSPLPKVVILTTNFRPPLPPNHLSSFEPSQTPTTTSQLQSQLIASFIKSHNPTSSSSSFENSTSPQSLALGWMVTQDEFARRFLLDSPDRLIQRFALATIWHATGGPTTWDKDDGWLNTTSAECEWRNFQDFGIICSSNGLVTGLFLADYGLSGSLPPEVRHLMALTLLNLANNTLTGKVPTELGLLTNLTLMDLSNNQLTGTVPTEIGQLTAIKTLNLARNQLTGKIPSELGWLTTLTLLNLANNVLTKKVPSELGQLSALTLLNLANNQLTGTILTELTAVVRQPDLTNDSLVPACPACIGIFAAILLP